MSQYKQANDAIAMAARASLTGARKLYMSPELTVYGTVRNLTGGSLDVGQDGLATGGKNVRSDRRLKENVVAVGQHPAGFGLYLFDYKKQFRDTCGIGRQFGVMADEVAPIYPDAVTTGIDGYSRVNYDRLGISRH